MNDDDLDLRSVNWSQGMFLTPDHFLRQERYVDSLFLWLLRYNASAHGLLGGGPRVDASERGAPRFDPVVEIDDSGETLKVSVLQCRGITPGGVIVDVQPSASISASFSKRELDGSTDLGIYVLARPHEKEPDDSVADPVNPQLPLGRRVRYVIRLDVQADEAPNSLLLTRLRRAERGLRFERVLNYIPPCALMSANSSLMHSFRQLNELVIALSDRYATLHGAIAEFIELARARGIGTDQDAETLAFVGRMATTLDTCAYEMLDPLQPPKRFFQELARLVRSAALFLSLSPPTRDYFRFLADNGSVEFVSMLQQEQEALQVGRGFSVNEDLNVEVQKATRSLQRFERLEQALEGKYMDYRVSPSLESINFVFDRSAGEAVHYKSVAKPTRPQAQGQELTFVFAPLRLEARETYRLILVGDPESQFVPGDRLSAELRINRGEGYTHKPDYLEARHEVDGQKNFALDFKAPEDVVLINDVRLSLRSTQPIRSAILYVRVRLQQGVTPVVTPGLGLKPAPPRPVTPPAPPPRPVDRTDGPRDSKDETRPPLPGRRNRLLD